MAMSHLEHLLALSNNSAVADARLKIIQALSDEELSALVKQGYRCTTRKTREIWSVNMLDLISAGQKATLEWPVSNNNPQQSMHSAFHKTDVDVIDIPSTPGGIPIFEIGTLASRATGPEDWQPLSNLDGETGDIIYARFIIDFAVDELKRMAYGRMTHNAGHHLSGDKCVNILVRQEGCGRSTFEKARGNFRRACDTCIRTKRLCVQIGVIDSSIKLCVMPLPEAYREGKALDSIAAWVMEG